MVEFLSREDTRGRIRELMDADDRLLLAAVVLLGHPSEEQLFQFLDDQIDFGHLHWKVANLKDRLLLISGSTPDTVRVNPVLEEELLQQEVQPEKLLAGRTLDLREGSAPEELPWFSRALATALYSFFREHREVFTRSGALRKRVVQTLEERFQPVFTGDTGRERFDLALRALETLGLVTRDEGTVILIHDAWDELCELPDNWIQGLLWATLVSTSVKRAFEAVPLLLEFCRTIPRDRWFTSAEIRRLLRLTGTGLTPGPDTPERLAETGLLLPHDRGFRLNGTAAATLERSRDTRSGAALHANMEITVSPELTFRALLDLAAIAFLRRFDVMPVLELKETSVTEARRIEREEAQNTLRRITGAPLPQNVSYLLEQWSSRAASARLIQGLVLRLEPETAGELEGVPEFLTCIEERLAPGIFLLRPENQDEIERILRRIGIGGHLRVETAQPQHRDVPEYRRLYQRLQQPALPARRGVHFQDIPPLEEPAGDHDSESATEDRRLDSGDNTPESLLHHLKQQNAPEEVERELALRIEHKLILFPDQIRSDIVPRYGVEARGLDYLGKIRIAEQAIQDKELLEVIMRTAAGTPQRLLVRPREIAESGGDLMLRALQLPENNPVRIRIRRASLVRRLSGTLLRRR